MFAYAAMGPRIFGASSSLSTQALSSQANCAVFDPEAAKAITLKREQGTLNGEERECCSYYYYYCHASTSA